MSCLAYYSLTVDQYLGLTLDQYLGLPFTCVDELILVLDAVEVYTLGSDLSSAYIPGSITTYLYATGVDIETIYTPGVIVSQVYSEGTIP